jgi:hypothetical protein
LGVIPVETPDSIRTGCGAITASNTAGIDNADQSLFIGIGSAHRTNLNTGRVLAMHTGPWKESGFDMGIFAFDIGKELNPVNGAALG